MKLPAWLLFSVACIIWGTTWFGIKLQLDSVVPPLYSIAYRFAIASIILFVFLGLSGKKLAYSFQQHLWFLLQGTLLFGLCYWLTYVAEVGLTSGLVAVLSSLIIFFNVLFGKLFLKRPIQTKLLIGFVVGVSGMVLLYKDELHTSGLNRTGLQLLIVAVLANVVASLGNLVSARNQSHGLPVPQTNAFSMAYGAIMVLVIGLIKGDALVMDWNFTYLGSLVYLAIFGSVIAFYCYLTLLGQLGAGKAAYVNLVIPIIALLVSSLFESFQWTPLAFIGLALVLLGNWVALSKWKLKRA